MISTEAGDHRLLLFHEGAEESERVNLQIIRSEEWRTCTGGISTTTVASEFYR
jgi:hypothetical protein